MIYFSYNDFVDCTENGEIEGITKVKERVARYQLKNEETSVVKDRNQFIEILKEKIELKKFISEFFNLSEIGNIGNIIYCDNIKSKYNIKNNNNIIYKIRDKEIFIFIKVIENIDNNISYKMFENSLNIIKRWNSEEKIKNKRYPIVIPIVIYTGEKQWKINNKKIHKKINYMTYQDNRINFSYNIVNICDLKINQLEKMKSKVAMELIRLKNKYLQIN